jgi:hypothetical protein
MALRNGNGYKHTTKTAIQASSLLAGEIASTLVEAPVLANIDKLDDIAPGPMGVIKGFIKNVIIKPFQTPIEWCLGKTKNIEGEEDYKRRSAMTEDQRADALTNGFCHYIPAFAAGIGTMKVVEHSLNRITKTPVDNRIYFIDPAVHLGSIALISSPLMSGTADKARAALNCVFKSIGMNDDKAKEMSKYAITVQIPNYFAYLVDVGALFYLNRKDALAKAASHIRL